MKTYRFYFQRTEFGYIDVQAENQEQAEDRYYENDGETITKSNQSIVEVEELPDDNEPALEDGGCMWNHDHKAQPELCEWHN
jgi:hypothetical protein